MWRILIALLLLAGCAEMQPAPQSAQAPRLDAAPGGAVIYIVRTPMDSKVEASLALDDRGQITTWGGTYYRWEVAPGVHRVAALGVGTDAVTLTAAAGNTYFLEHTVIGNLRHGAQLTTLRQVNDQRGRDLMRQAQAL